MVQIEGDSKNRENWRVGKITALIKGLDNECRVARVKVDGKEFTRSISQLYPLEVEEEISTSDGSPIMDVPEDHLTGRVTLLPELCESVEETPSTEEGNTLENNATPTVNHDSVDKPTPVLGISIGSPSQETEVSGVHPEIIESNEPVVYSDERSEDKVRRGAAIRARENIAQWTRQLVTLL